MFSNVNYYKKPHTKYNRQHYYLPGFLALWIFTPRRGGALILQEFY